MSTDAKTTQRSLRTPLPNTYWVEPGRLLAGEHPSGTSWSITVERLQALLAAGVTLFVDLTEEHEQTSYAKLFDYVSLERPLLHLRMPMPDHGIPKSPQVMRDVLAAIERHLADDGVAYVHCRAGIGRTGMTVGCYLVQHGFSGDQAIDHLNTLWCESERSRTWPTIPETDAQSDYVVHWAKQMLVAPLESVAATNISNASASNVETPHATTAVESTPATLYEGLLLGMAIGDALGASQQSNAETQPLVGGGPLSLPSGAWLADTAMTLSLAQSLFTNGGNDPQDQMQRYLAWQRDGVCSSTGVALAVPDELRRALAQWQWSRKPVGGSHDPNNRDVHPLARTAAVAMYFGSDSILMLHEAGEAARPTLQSPVVLDACRAYAALLSAALAGADKPSLLAFRDTAESKALRSRRLKQEVAQFIDGGWRELAMQRKPATADRDILQVFSVALWAFERSDRYSQGALLAINADPLSATIGAVYGALAGAHFGVPAIPARWRSSVLLAAQLVELAQRFAAHREPK